MKKKLAIAALFTTALLERTVFDLGPNVELITLVMLISASFLGEKWSFLLTLALLAVTDLVIGNTKIFLFTWSGFLIPSLVASRIFARLKAKGTKLIGLATLTGVSSNLFFFIWTNFGVWLLDSWGMYSRNMSGLILCFVNGLPFLKNQLTSTLVFVPLGFFLFETAFLPYFLPKNVLGLEKD